MKKEDWQAFRDSRLHLDLANSPSVSHRQRWALYELLAHDFDNSERDKRHWVPDLSCQAFNYPDARRLAADQTSIRLPIDATLELRPHPLRIDTETNPLPTRASTTLTPSFGAVAITDKRRGGVGQ